MSSESEVGKIKKCLFQNVKGPESKEKRWAKETELNKKRENIASIFKGINSVKRKGRKNGTCVLQEGASKLRT